MEHLPSEVIASAIARAEYQERQAVIDAKIWIADYAEGYGISYEEIMETAWTHVEDEDGNTRGWGNYITGGAEMEGENTSDEFWDKFEIVTGKSVSRYTNFFNCSC